MKPSTRDQHRKETTRSAPSRTKRQILPALVAVGGACGLAAGPLAALELGELSVESNLGQPLRASIAYALNPGEQISGLCIQVIPPARANGIAGVGNPHVLVTDNAILLRGLAPIREPLLAMQVAVNCPQAANLARDYTLMIDLPLPVNGRRVVPGNDGVSAATVRISPVAAPQVVAAPQAAFTVSTTTTPKDESPIAAGSRYRVRPGDSLSEIASRIDGRTIALWPAVDAIFAANPDAFLNNDPGLVKAGAWLNIPDLTGASPLPAISGVSELQPEQNVADSMPLPANVSTANPDVVAQPALIVDVAPVIDIAPAIVAESAEPAMRPVDIEVDAVPAIALAIATVVVDIPDTIVQAPLIAPAPAIVGTDASATWSRWLGGAGLALATLLMMFGRRIRDQFGLGFGAIPAAAPPVEPDIEIDIDITSTVTVSQISVYTVGLPVLHEEVTILVDEIPPIEAERGDNGNTVETSKLIERAIEDEDATVKDLNTLTDDSSENSQFVLINDFERQVFERDYDAAKVAVSTSPAAPADSAPDLTTPETAENDDHEELSVAVEICR